MDKNNFTAPVMMVTGHLSKVLGHMQYSNIYEKSHVIRVDIWTSTVPSSASYFSPARNRHYTFSVACDGLAKRTCIENGKDGVILCISAI